ncbi:MAG: hypothetical protein WCI94_10635 [Rhodospirillales bacterium]
MGRRREGSDAMARVWHRHIRVGRHRVVLRGIPLDPGGCSVDVADT